MLTALLVLIIIAAVSIPLLFDANVLRTHISSAAEDQTGRELRIGTVKLSVFPWLRVRLSDVEMPNASGFGPGPFAQAREIAVGVKLMPLLFDHRLEASAIEIDSLRLDLATHADGTTNWDDLVTHMEAKEQQAPPNPPPGAPGEDELPWTFSIAGLSVKHSSLRFEDGVAGQTYALSEINLDTGGIEAGAPFDLSASARAASTVQTLDAQLSFEGRMVPDFDTRTLRIENLVAELEGSGEGLKTTGRMTGLGRFDWGAQHLALDNLRLALEATGAAVPAQTQKAELEGSFGYELRKGRLDAPALKLQAAGIEASGKLSGEGLNTDTPALSGTVSTHAFNPRELLGKLGMPAPDTTDPKALSQLQLNNAAWRFSGGAWAVDQLDARLDDSHLSGSAEYRSGPDTGIRFELTVDQLDADRYTPAATAENAEAAEGAEASANGKAQRGKPIYRVKLPYEALAPFDLDGHLKLGKLRLSGLQAQQASIRLSGPRNAAKQLTLALRLYQGSLAAEARLPPSAQQPVKLKADLQNLAMEPLLRDYSGDAKLRGTGSAQLEVSGRGATIGQLRRRAEGRLALSFRDGAVIGFNLAQQLRQAQAALRGQTLQDDAPRETDFASITVSAQLAEGVLRSDDLDARNPLLRVGGEGSADLIHETLDYLARPTVVATSKGQGGKSLDELRGLTIPIRIKGKFADPKVRIELEEAFKQKATDQLRKQFGDDTEIQNKVNREVNRALDNLLGTKKKKKKEADSSQDGASAPAQEPN